MNRLPSGVKGEKENRQAVLEFFLRPIPHSGACSQAKIALTLTNGV